MNLRTKFCTIGAGFWGIIATSLADPVVLEDFEDLTGWNVSRKPALFEAAPEAAVGKGAITVTLPGQVAKSYTRSYLPGSAAWDAYEGVSFWIKGDGSDQFGCMALTGRYPFVTFFPLKNTEWHRVTLPWYAFVPESQVSHIGEFGAMPPSGIRGIRFGTRWTIWHNNDKIPTHSFSVDQVQLEEHVDSPVPLPQPRAFGDVLALLKAGKPIRIQCMGDSITAGTGLSDRDKERYAVLTQNLLRRWLGNEQITCYSRAVGGAKLTDARAWVPRDFCDDPPDLVTMWYGYNDKSNAHTQEYFKRSLNDYIDRICRKTGGKTSILLFATGPGTGPRFVMMDDFAQAVRGTARERGLPCFDISNILKSIGREHIQDYYGDMAHPNKEGHALIADALCQFLVDAAGITTPKPEPPPKPEVEPGKPQAWGFEDGPEGWTFDTDDVTLNDAQAKTGKQAVRFLMTGVGTDHRRAWSPALPAIPCQRYHVEAAIQINSLPEGHMGVYMATYATADASGPSKIHPIQRGQTALEKWQMFSGNFEVPEETASMRIMVWAERKSIGEFYLDDAKLTPLP